MLLPEIAEFEFITFVETFPTAQFNSNRMEKKLMHDNVFGCWNSISKSIHEDFQWIIYGNNNNK